MVRLCLRSLSFKRPNLFIKIPGTTEGLPAIEEAIFAGVPVNVTLLFSAAGFCS
jgi:transaldolase